MSNIPQFDQTDAELEAWLLFSVAVAGKNADTTWKAVRKLIELLGGDTPFAGVRKSIDNSTLISNLMVARVGQYGKLNRAYRQIINLNPRTCTLEELEAIPGIGPKTARMFLMYSRPDFKAAVLDTHILKWLRAQGIDAPRSTPPKGAKYAHFEKIFLDKCAELGRDPKELDYEIWSSYAVRNKENVR